METETRALVIKMTQKNKETQTVKMGVGMGPSGPWFGPMYQPIQCNSEFPGNTIPEFYMDREEVLYRRACELKGIRVKRDNEIRIDEGDFLSSDDDRPKPTYRYTLDEMKSYNPYRYINF